jgi:hypothetical protein
MLVTEGDFCRIIQDTWTATLGFPVDRSASAEFPATGAFTVCVRISGAWDGEVTLHCSDPLARRIAGAIFQLEADKVGSYEILDALSELIHIVGGNLKALLPQPVVLSFPSLPDPTVWEHATGHWQMVYRQTLLSEGFPFVVTLWGDFPAAGRAEYPAAEESPRPAENPQVV